MIVSQNTIKAAGCILPVTKKLDLQGRPGLRHRAGIGITEVSDAIAIIVSEESSKVSIAHDGTIEPVQSEEQLLEFFDGLGLNMD